MTRPQHTPTLRVYPQVWKIISPWLDEEILGKTFFAPNSVDDVEKAIAWVDKKSLQVGPA